MLCSLFILSPYSMTIEKVISHSNNIKLIHRLLTSEETINARMFITLYRVGTAVYDPRPAVAEFLRKEERPNRELDFGLYVERDFIQNFFRENSSF